MNNFNANQANPSLPAPASTSFNVASLTPELIEGWAKAAARGQLNAQQLQLFGEIIKFKPEVAVLFQREQALMKAQAQYTQQQQQQQQQQKQNQAQEQQPQQPAKFNLAAFAPEQLLAININVNQTLLELRAIKVRAQDPNLSQDERARLNAQADAKQRQITPVFNELKRLGLLQILDKSLLPTANTKPAATSASNNASGSGSNTAMGANAPLGMSTAQQEALRQQMAASVPGGGINNNLLRANMAGANSKADSPKPSASPQPPLAAGLRASNSASATNTASPAPSNGPPRPASVASGKPNPPRKSPIPGNTNPATGNGTGLTPSMQNQYSAIAQQQQQHLANNNNNNNNNNNVAPQHLQAQAGHAPNAPTAAAAVSRAPPMTFSEPNSDASTPAPTPFPAPRASLTGGGHSALSYAGVHKPPQSGVQEALGHGASGGSAHGAGVQGDPGSGVKVESVGRCVSKRKIQELVEALDPGERLEGDVEDLCLEVADEFIDSVTRFACQLAKHRKSERLECKDIQLHLERTWNIRVPGFSNDEIRLSQNRKANVSPAYQARVAAVREAARTKTRAGGV